MTDARKIADDIDAELDALVTLCGLTASEAVSGIITQRMEVSLRLLQRVRSMLGRLIPCEPTIEQRIAALPTSVGRRCTDPACTCNGDGGSFADDMLASVPAVASLAVDAAIAEDAA